MILYQARMASHSFHKTPATCLLSSQIFWGEATLWLLRHVSATNFRIIYFSQFNHQISFLYLLWIQKRSLSCSLVCKSCFCQLHIICAVYLRLHLFCLVHDDKSSFSLKHFVIFFVCLVLDLWLYILLIFRSRRGANPVGVQCHPHQVADRELHRGPLCCSGWVGQRAQLICLHRKQRAGVRDSRPFTKLVDPASV